MKRSPLQRKTPLRSGSQLKRGKPMRQVSKKREKLNRARRDFVAGFLAARPRCEAREPIMNHDVEHRCHIWSVDVHEVVTRARGGSILDPDNCRAICRACHDWIHANPKAATEAGLLASRLPSNDGLDDHRP